MRRERQIGMVLLFCGLGFVCVNQRDLRETLWFILCGLFEYASVYSLADHAEGADECSKLHYFAEKDRLETLKYPLDMTVYDFL